MTDLYRVFGEDGRLLYVGIAEDFDDRLYTHSLYEPWFLYALHVAVEEFPTRELAAAAELEAIRSEWPLWNRHASPFRSLAELLRRQAAEREKAQVQAFAPDQRGQLLAYYAAERDDRDQRLDALVNVNHEIVGFHAWGGVR